jgi:hypothetical protein
VPTWRHYFRDAAISHAIRNGEGQSRIALQRGFRGLLVPLFFFVFFCSFSFSDASLSSARASASHFACRAHPSGINRGLTLCKPSIALRAERYQCLNFSNREEAACQTTYTRAKLYLEQ